MGGGESWDIDIKNMTVSHTSNKSLVLKDVHTNSQHNRIFQGWEVHIEIIFVRIHASKDKVTYYFSPTLLILIDNSFPLQSDHEYASAEDDDAKVNADDSASDAVDKKKVKEESKQREEAVTKAKDESDEKESTKEDTPKGDEKKEESKDDSGGEVEKRPEEKVQVADQEGKEGGGEGEETDQGIVGSSWKRLKMYLR